MELYGHALLVGIDAYQGEPYLPLETPVRDVTAIRKLLERDHDDRRRWHVTSLLGPKKSGQRVTKESLLAAIDELLENASGSGHALLYFAGHGVDHGRGGRCLVLQGRKSEHPDLELDMDRVVNAVLDHDVSAVRSATVILDCCYAGELASDPTFPIRKGRAVLMSSSDVTPDGTGNLSPFARRVVDALGGDGALLTGEVTLTGLFEHVSRRFGADDSRPQLMINLATEPVVLTRVKPKIDVAKLTKLFPYPEDPKPLSWEHEGPIHPSDKAYCNDCEEEQNHHHGRQDPATYAPTEKQLEFDAIRGFYSHGLIKTHDDRAPYWVAMKGLDVRLSPLGRWYWDQRDMGLI